MTDATAKSLQDNAQQEIETHLSNTAAAILALGEKGAVPEYNEKARIDCFFQLTDSTINGTYFTGGFGKYVGAFYESYACNPDSSPLKGAIAAWVTLGAEGHEPLMQNIFFTTALEAAQTPANKKAIAAWFAHEHAKGNNLCADRRTALQSTAKALGLDLK